MKRQHYKSAGSATAEELFSVQFLESGEHFNRQITSPKLKKGSRSSERTQHLSPRICLVSQEKKIFFFLFIEKHFRQLNPLHFGANQCLLVSALLYCRQQYSLACNFQGHAVFNLQMYWHKEGNRCCQQ